jgi:hypothetical protein
MDKIEVVKAMIAINKTQVCVKKKMPNRIIKIVKMVQVTELLDSYVPTKTRRSTTLTASPKVILKRVGHEENKVDKDGPKIKKMIRLLRWVRE